MLIFRERLLRKRKDRGREKTVIQFCIFLSIPLSGILVFLFAHSSVEEREYAEDTGVEQQLLSNSVTNVDDLLHDM